MSKESIIAICEAHDEGSTAALIGVSSDNNDYPEGSIENIAWDIGWTKVYKRVFDRHGGMEN